MILAFIVGMFVGGTIGIVLMAALAISRHADERRA